LRLRYTVEIISVFRSAAEPDWRPPGLIVLFGLAVNIRRRNSEDFDPRAAILLTI
jgi:hypothetical protein